MQLGLKISNQKGKKSVCKKKKSLKKAPNQKEKEIEGSFLYMKKSTEKYEVFHCSYKIFA
jgi:hypothetical protein